MGEDQTARQSSWRAKLASRLPAVGQAVVLLAIAIVLLLPAPFTSNLLPAGGQGSDLTISHWPTALLIQRTITQEHRLPLWNPYFAGGEPFAADSLAALFYPPTHLVDFLPLRAYYLTLIMGPLIFAGLGMLLLARRAVGLPRLPALVAAVSFMATPRLLSHLGAGHVTIFQTVSWYPWLALSCWATVREPRRWGAALGICIGLTLLAGHPQMAYYGLLMTAVLAAWLLVRRWWQEGHRALFMSGTGLAGAGVIGVLMAAGFLLPLLEFTALSTRQHTVNTTDIFPLQKFLRAVIDQTPARIHPWETMLTPGLVVLALALLAIIIRWRKLWPLLLAIVLVAGLAMGNSSPIYLYASRIFTSLQQFRGVARIWFVALFIIALLAGIGADVLLRGVERISLRRTVPAGILVVFIVAVTLIVTDIGYARLDDIYASTTPSPLARAVERLAGSGDVYNVQHNLPQVYAVEMQIPFANGQAPLLINSFVSYMHLAGDYSYDGYQLAIPAYDSSTIQPDARLLGLVNVSVVVSNRPLTDPHLVLAGKVDGVLIYKNTAVAGPGYLVQPGSDGKPPSLDHVQRLTTTIRTVTNNTDLQEFTFSSGSPAYFVIAMPTFPGWIASLDGHPVTVQQIAGVLPAIKAGPGKHTLSYHYDPPSARNGAMLSLVGLLIALAWFTIGRRFIPTTIRLPKKHRH